MNLETLASRISGVSMAEIGRLKPYPRRVLGVAINRGWQVEKLHGIFNFSPPGSDTPAIRCTRDGLFFLHQHELR
jgi:hypothetical protein